MGRGRKVKIQRGLDIPLAGQPDQETLEAKSVSTVALLGVDYPSLRPRMEVEVGDAVKRGQPLFVERKDPEVRFNSPGAGVVKAINRGDKRRLLSVVVELNDEERAEDGGEGAEEVPYEALADFSIDDADAEKVRAVLLETGHWTSIRMRPYGRVPNSESVPISIFVTAVDTRPHCVSSERMLSGGGDDLALGLQALTRLGAPLHLCTAPGSELSEVDLRGVTVHEFAGPHPAGLTGVHINAIDPVERGRVAWYVNVRDVAQFGETLRTGRVPVSRVIAMGGEPFERPRLLATRAGASVDVLVEGEMGDDRRRRLLSGSILDGRPADSEGMGFLGRYDYQIAAVYDDVQRELFGWMAPKLVQSLWTEPLLRRLFSKLTLRAKTALNGEERPLIPIGRYELYMPYRDIPAPLLFRALLCGDLENAVALGALELEEEDLALCSYVCPSKIDFGRHLRETLTALEKEGG